MARLKTALLLASCAPTLVSCALFSKIVHSLFRDASAWPQLLSSLSVAASIGTVSGESLWNPTVGASWNIKLLDVPKPAQADDDSYHIWDFDMAEAPKSLIDAFHAKGHPVICYFSAGSWENFRKDKDEFPKASLGKVMDGWPDERWVDISNPGVRKLMKKRIEKAAAKGCDGIDPDNINGYENDTGLDLTKDETVDFVKFLAKTAHDLGMSFGLKNGGAIVERVVDVSQWCIVEQCVKYNECQLYQPFIKKGKPVLHIEYTEKDPAPPKFVSKACGNSHAKGFSTLIKHLNLNSWTTTCP